MTPDHPFPLLESEADSELFTRVGSLLAVARVPHVILEAIRVGAFDSPQQASRRGQRDRRWRHIAKPGGTDDGETILQEG